MIQIWVKPSQKKRGLRSKPVSVLEKCAEKGLGIVGDLNGKFLRSPVENTRSSIPKQSERALLGQEAIGEFHLTSKLLLNKTNKNANLNYKGHSSKRLVHEDEAVVFNKNLHVNFGIEQPTAENFVVQNSDEIHCRKERREWENAISCAEACAKNSSIIDKNHEQGCLTDGVDSNLDEFAQSYPDEYALDFLFWRRS